MSWSFALVNNRLAEIFFEKGKKKAKIIGHCYVQEKEYKTKREKKQIKEDTARVRLVYRKERYYDIRNLKLPKFKTENQKRNFWSKIQLTDYFEPADFDSVSFSKLKPLLKLMPLRKSL
jgi:hypothetical protein